MSLQNSIISLKEDRAAYSSDLKVPSRPVGATFVHGTEVRIALGGNNRPMLLLPVSSEELRKKLPEAEGLVMEYVQYKGTSSATGFFLQVTSRNDQLESVFLDLVENICGRIRNGESSNAALAEAIDEFRDLLSRSRQQVDRSRILGLMGELIFLSKALDSNPEAVDFWTGPSGARRDFLFPKAAFEIKATQQSTGRNVTIHSMAQLAVDDADSLFVMFYRLEEDPGKGIYVSEIVKTIKSKIDSVDVFEKKLGLIGYSPSDSDSWDAAKWTLLEAQPYQVSDGFPRVIASSFPDGLPRGVSQINYQLDLDQAKEYRISEADLSGRLSS